MHSLHFTMETVGSFERRGEHQSTPLPSLLHKAIADPDAQTREMLGEHPPAPWQRSHPLGGWMDLGLLPRRAPDGLCPPKILFPLTSLSFHKACAWKQRPEAHTITVSHHFSKDTLEKNSIKRILS